MSDALYPRRTEPGSKPGHTRDHGVFAKRGRARRHANSVDPATQLRETNACTPHLPRGPKPRLSSVTYRNAELRSAFAVRAGRLQHAK